MQKNLALIAKYFKKIYKPTNNNLGTSSKSKNKNVDTTLRYVNENQVGQFGNQRTVTVAGARETVGSQETKRAKDYTYHKEKMFLCKQAEKGVPLQADQADWLENTDEKLMNKNWKHITVSWQRFRRQHSEQLKSINDTHVVEKDDSNIILDSSNMCDNDNQADQNAEEYDDERVVLLI
ncbi:hypothetical protein Tco_0857550 [Tanacetum coccineum]|uniref:Uncharacterized protein n=1 Tax=Tanacetum coccineum TaxID=301880 RepID=A0ABQ5B7M6_9ASTR